VKQVLEPLTRIPGVRVAALVTPDGVPITVHGAQRRAAPKADEANNASTEAADDVHALAALATGWIGEVNRAVAPLCWPAPGHLMLRAARGTIIVMQAPGALLLVVLESGMRAEELRLPMEGAVARMQRHLRGIGSKNGTTSDLDHQPSILPSRVESGNSHEFADERANRVSATGNEIPEVPGE
jgi:predicted regulator of Ras-like GTPase activity (Roadblock/LC7/MglB family)